MSTQSQQYALAQNGNFQQRCIAAALTYGIGTVFGEGAVTNHANRLALMQQVVLFPDTWAARFARACVFANVNLQNAAPNDTTATDADITVAVAAVWSGLADAAAALQTAKQI